MSGRREGTDACGRTAHGPRERAASAARRTRRLALTVACALLAGGPALGATDTTLEAFVDAVMAEHLERYELAGAAVTVVRDGAIVLSKGYGYADLARAHPVEPAATLFSTASVAKLFTWTALMQLVERGLVDLDADVNTYLSAVQVPDAFAEPVRVRDLLAHTTGFEDAPVVGLVARAGDDVPDLETALARWMPRRVEPPGRTISYSNYGSALAGQIVAEVSGMTWEAYLEAHVLWPLGMTRSSPRQPLPAGWTADLATSYAQGLVETPFEYTTIAPSGGMVATTHDMAAFMIAHLQDGRYGATRILEEATAQRMHAQLFTHHPALPGNAHGFWEGEASGVRTLHHRGDTSSYTKLVLVPEHGFGFYVAYNAPDGSLARDAFATALLEHALPTPDVRAQALPVRTPGSYDGLVGTYGDTRRSATTLAKMMGLLATFTISSVDGALVTTLPGFGEQRWVEVEPLVFADAAGPGRLAFRMDERGRATHVAFSAFPETTFAATRGIDRPELHAALFVVWLVAALSALVAWPWFGRRAGRDSGVAVKVRTRVARRLPAVASLLHLAFVATLVAPLLDVGELELGVGPWLATGLTLNLVAAALTLVGAGCAVWAWRRGAWSTVERLHYTVVVLAGAALAWQLHHWNLLGIRV